MAWIEVEIKTFDDDGVNWEKMGAKPKKPKTIYKRRMVSTVDLEFMDELSDEETTAKFNWSEEPITLKGSYETLTSLVVSADDEQDEEPEDTEKDLTI